MAYTIGEEFLLQEILSNTIDALFVGERILFVIYITFTFIFM